MDSSDLSGIFLGYFYFAITLLPVWISLILRKISPDKLWLGIIVSFVFNGFGHFYRKGGFSYCMVILLIQALILVKTENEMIAIVIPMLLSPFIMFFRFRLPAIKNIEDGGGSR